MPTYKDEEGNVYIDTNPDDDWSGEEAAEEGTAIDDDTSDSSSSSDGSSSPDTSDPSSSDNSVDQPDTLFEQYQDDSQQYQDKDGDGIPDSQQGSVTVTGDASEGEEQKVVGQGDGAYASEKSEADAAANQNFDAAQGTDVDRIEERLAMGQGDVQETDRKNERTQRKDQRTQKEIVTDRGLQNLQKALKEEKNEVTEEDIRQYNRSQVRDQDIVSAQTPGVFENPTNLSLSLMRRGNEVSQESAETVEQGIQNYRKLESQEENLENLEKDVQNGQALIYEGETYTGAEAEEKVQELQENNQQAQKSTKDTLEKVSKVNEYAQSEEYENLKQYQEAQKTGIGGRAGEVRNDNSIAENLIIEGTANMAYYDRQADNLQQDIENSERAQEFIRDINTGAARVSDNPAFAVVKPGQFAVSQLGSDEQFEELTEEVVSSAPYGPQQLVSFGQAAAGAVPRSLVATGKNLNPETPDAQSAGFGEGFVKGYEVTGRQLAENPTEFVGEELGEEIGEAIATGGIGGLIYTASPNIELTPSNTVDSVKNYASSARSKVSDIELTTRKGQSAVTTPDTRTRPGRNPASDPIADPENFLEVQPEKFSPITQAETKAETTPEATETVQPETMTRGVYGTVTPTETVAENSPVAEELSEVQNEFQPESQPETIAEPRTEASPETETLSPSLETAIAETKLESQIETEIRPENKTEIKPRIDLDDEDEYESSKKKDQESGGTGPGYDASLDALLFNIEAESQEQISNPLKTRPIRKEIEKTADELDKDFKL